MSPMTIRDLDDATAAGLRLRAARHGRSMEEEARNILRAAVANEAAPPSDLGRAIHERFAALGGVDLPGIPREAGRTAVIFEE